MTVSLLLLVTILVISAALALIYPPNEEIQALKQFYDSTGGDYWQWKNVETYGMIWNFSSNSTNPCNNWQGISCNATYSSYNSSSDDSDTISGNIVGISLISYNLSGFLPPNISYFKNLSTLYLDKNNIYGTLPRSICNLTSLREITMQHNALTGSINECFTKNLHDLSTMKLDWNYFTGTFPEFYEDSTPNLFYLSISNNFLHGRVPQSIRFVNQTLQALFINNNYLTGNIYFLPYLTELRAMAVKHNAFTGDIPANISRISKLLYWYVHINYLTGSIPASICQLNQLIYWNSWLNYFTGVIPHEISNFTKLIRFASPENFHSGTLPYTVGQMQALKDLTLYNNLLSGTLPSSLTNLSNLATLLLQSNHFTDKLVQAFNRTSQKSLAVVLLAENRFTGTLSVDLFNTNLRGLGIFQTCLHGSIPEAVCDAKGLLVLVLNGLTAGCSKKIWPLVEDSPRYALSIPGSVPACLWELPALRAMHLSGNGLTGSIPAKTSYFNLTALDLSYNSLTGTIPAKLQEHKQLLFFNLKSNRLTGEIRHIGELNYTTTEEEVGVELKLSSNRLSGPLPESLKHAQRIDILDGSLFPCRYSHLPPEHDPGNENYVCGSDVLDIAVSTGGAVTGIILLIILVLLGFIHAISNALPHRPGRVRRSGIEDTAINSTSSRTSLTLAQLREEESEKVKRFSIFSLWKFFAEDLMFNYGHLSELVRQRDKIISALRATENINSFVLQREVAVRFILKVLMWRARLRDLDEKVIGLRFGNLQQFLKSMQSLRLLALWLMLANLTISLPLLATLKRFFHTFHQQYRWYFSGAFLSGYQPAIAIFLLWMLLVTFTLAYIAFHIPETHQHALILQEIKKNSLQRIEHILRAQKDTNDDQDKDLESADELQTDDADLSLPQQKADIDRLSTSVHSPSFVLHRIQVRNTATRSFSVHLQASILGRLRYFTTASFWISLSALLTDMVVVVIFKSIFVYLIFFVDFTFDLKMFFGGLLSLCDVLWSSLVVPQCINLLPKKTPTGRMLLKLSVLFFNSVVAPCLAVMLTNDSCFLGIFRRADTVSINYPITYCITFDTHGEKCLQEGNFDLAEEYTPSFVYNFNCYSTVITDYTPIFLFTYLLLFLLLPATILFFLSERATQTLALSYAPEIFQQREICSAPTSKTTMRSHETEVEMTAVTNALFSEKKRPEPQIPADVEVLEASALETQLALARESMNAALQEFGMDKNRLFFPGFILASMMHHLFVLLTFGMVYPPLSCLVCLVIWAVSCSWEVAIGRWLQIKELEYARTRSPSVAGQSGEEKFLQSYESELPLSILDKKCARVCCSPRRTLPLIAFGSASFVGLMLFDMSGDAIGWQASLWAPLAAAFYAAIALFIVEKLIVYEHFEYYQHDARRPSAAPGPSLPTTSKPAEENNEEERISSENNSG